MPIDGAVVQVGKAGGGGAEESQRSAVGSGVLSVTHGILTRGNKNVDECGVVNMCVEVLCEVVINWIVFVIEVERMKDEVEVVVVGGPSNSLGKHGKEGERGFGGERRVRVTKDKDGDDEWNMTYHLTDPVKLTMTEKAELVEKMVDMMVDMKRCVGEDVRIVHVTMFPRFVEQCCREHMTEEEVWLLDGIRRDVNREVKDMLLESGYDIEVVDWWTLVGARNELTVNEMRRSGMIDNDNVHLTSKSNRVAAASLMCRLLEKRESESKRRRME